MSSTKIYLVRHGESEWNRVHRYTGQQDPPLSELGWHQAECLARRLEAESLAAIYASPLQRACQTATPTAERLNLPILLDAGLAEIHHGLWEGLTSHEVAAQYGDGLAQWRAQPHLAVMPEGESLDEVGRRAIA